MSMPDFDIDFCQDGPRSRHRLREEQVRRRLGVADRDVRHDGRARPRCATSAACSTSPLHLLRRHRQADPVPARQARHAEGGARRWSRCSPSASRRRKRCASSSTLAESLEGLTRNVGMHAGGVLIAPGKLTDFCPLYAQPGADGARLAVRQGRRRGDRARQVRLPRPHHAHDPRLDACATCGARSGEPT